MPIEDRNGHVHGRDGKYTVKQQGEPGADAQLAEPVSDAGDEDAPLTLDDPRVAEALGSDPADLDARQREVLAVLIDGDTLDGAASTGSYPDDVLDYWDAFSGDVDDLDELGRIMAQHYGYETSFDIDYTSFDGPVGITTTHHAPGLGAITWSEDLKAYRLSDEEAQRPGLGKALALAESLAATRRLLVGKANKYAVGHKASDISLEGTPGMGSAARRVSPAEARFVAPSGIRYHVTPLDEAGEPQWDQSRLLRLTSFEDDLSFEDGTQQSLASVHFGTDRSGALYLLTGAGKPQTVLTAADPLP